MRVHRRQDGRAMVHTGGSHRLPSARQPRAYGWPRTEKSHILSDRLLDNYSRTRCFRCSCVWFLVRNIVAFANTVTSLMAAYYQLIARALANLGNADKPQRAAVYECVRAALVKELSSLTPPPAESEIARERMSLETAIR